MEYRLEILSYYPASLEGKKRVCVCVCVCVCVVKVLVTVVSVMHGN